MDRHEQTRIEILRRLTPGERLRAAMESYGSARQLKASVLRADHPDRDERRIEDAVKEAFRRDPPY